MRFTADTHILREVSKAPASCSPTVELAVRDGLVTVSGRSETIGVSRAVGAFDTADGTVIVPSATFHRAVSVMPPGTVVVELDDRTVNMVAVNRDDPADSVTFTLRALEPVGVSTPPETKMVAEGIPAHLWAELVRRVIPAAANRSETAEELKSILMRPLAGALTIVATDRYRLHYIESLAVEVTGWNGEAIIPVQSVDQTLNVFKHGDLTFSAGPTHVSWSNGADTVTAALINATYPDHRKLVSAPRTGCQQVCVPTASLLEAIRRSTPIADANKEHPGIVTVTSTPEDMVLTLDAEAPDMGASTVSIPCHSTSGAALSFTINAKQFLEAVNAAHSERVEIWARDSSAPVSIGPFGSAQFRAVIATQVS